MKFTLAFLLLILVHDLHAQSITQKIAAAYTSFEKDAQLKNSISSLHIIDAKTGKVVFSRNSETGLAPASTQKIITSATAFELLGSSFRYVTEFAISAGNQANPNLYINASGDPTLGSWRWKMHSETEVLSRLTGAIQKSGVKTIRKILAREKGWESELVPDGWIWQDVGNYYGAGAAALNWRENQYDLYLQSGKKIGDPVIINGMKPMVRNFSFQSYVTSAGKGTGDQSYIYLPVGSNTINVRGTIPVDEEKFVISGSMPNPGDQFISTLLDTLVTLGIQTSQQNEVLGNENARIIHVERSPVLDSIVYWFLKKSINLYGEALVKTIANRGGENATIYNGVKKLKEFWAAQGIAKTELNMVDGSGLSPLNRVTTNAQVKVLQYAKNREWFKAYFDGFPEFNGMKMKSGTISGAKGFCGYHTSRSGNEYIFSFIVNNYNGSASSLVQKMYKVLDVLK